MDKYTIKNARIINRGEIIEGDVLVSEGRIEKISSQIDTATKEIDASGNYLMPGIIDDQVHFREPGLTHKANIYTESKAAVAGGTTSYMEMPNTKPSAISQDLLQDKYDIAKTNSWCNYSFFMGASNDNYEEVMKTDKNEVCGVKIFMGSSTGNMLVDEERILESYFSDVDFLIATHCEDEPRVRQQMDLYKNQFGLDAEAELHPKVRDVEACYLSSSKAVEMAKKYKTRLHILHISTAKELELFEKGPIKDKHITAEVCVHHLSYSDEDYAMYGNGIKCNPAIKSTSDQKALWKALMDDVLDVVATDHAPHTWEEKSRSYWDAPSGLPLVQHSLAMMLQHYHKGRISLEKIVEKMCHAPAELFDIGDRGYLDEGKMADMVLFDENRVWMPRKSNIHYKCNWSNLENHKLKGRVLKTFINGRLVYDHGSFLGEPKGMRLKFNRN